MPATRRPRTPARPAAVVGKAAAAPLVLDLTFAFDTALGAGRGIARHAFDALAARGPALVAATKADRAAGRFPFLELPARTELVTPVVRFAAARRPKTTDVLLVGIGGSSRGAAVLAATRRANKPTGKGRPRLHVLDTVDPHRIGDLLAVLDPRTTTVVAISKAGSTIETIAGLLLAETWLERAVGAKGARERIAIVCGEEPNPLRARATARGYATFPVPKGVGGRFSVLSPVGLLPAALLGIDVRAVLRGAAAVRAQLERPDAAAHPALALACLHHASATSGRNVTVCLPYGDALQPFALWWEQLVAESLGKKGSAGPVGVTPLPGVGPSDQHSLIQLLIDGPDDKLTVFVEAASLTADRLAVPKGGEALSVASGQRLGAILAAEREATELALTEASRPSVTVRLPDTGPASMGALMYVYEVATMWWGRLADVDPFDQPAVERGKVATTAALTGTPAEAVEALAKHRATRRVLSQ